MLLTDWPIRSFQGFNDIEFCTSSRKRFVLYISRISCEISGGIWYFLIYLMFLIFSYYSSAILIYPDIFRNHILVFSVKFSDICDKYLSHQPVSRVTYCFQPLVISISIPISISININGRTVQHPTLFCAIPESWGLKKENFEYLSLFTHFQSDVL